MKKNDIWLKLFRIFLPLVVGVIVSIIIKDSIDYEIIVKPPFAPPSFLFPIAWTIIYLLMGIAYYLFRKNGNENTNKVIIVYYLQLLVNALWSIIFFVFKWRLLAIIWIILLLILVVYLFVSFGKKDKTSAYLLIPYVVWLVFATYLNIGIYLLN